MQPIQVRACLPVAVVLFLFIFATPAAAKDIAGSKDHLMFSRFPGSVIIGYDQRAHQVSWVPTKPTTAKGFAAGEWAIGNFAWIVYQAPANRSTLEIFRNYEAALKKAGFEVKFSCMKKDCGPNFVRQMLTFTSRMVGSYERWMPDTGRYIGAKLSQDGGEIWASVLVHERNAQGSVAIRLEITEKNEPRKLKEFRGTSIGQKKANYDEAKMVAGGSVKNQLKEVLELEGEISWNAIRYERSVSAYEIYASTKAALAEGGSRVLFECYLKWCGSGFIRKAVDLNGNIAKGGEQWSQDSGYYVLGKKSSPEKTVYFGMLSYMQPNGLAVSRMLSVIPQTPEFDLISVTAASMARDIEKDGKVAVYGIYFDTDKSDIKPESASTLKEIAGLMQLRPELSIYVDGHTDDQGADDYNLDLSRKRASAVVDYLVEIHGIAVDRVEARGLGESAPVSSNDSEAGRAWNRRVELVARPAN